MRPTLDRNRASASKSFKTVPKERSRYSVEHTKPEREGTRSPIKSRPKEHPLPTPVIAEEPETEEAAPEIKADTVFEIETPAKPSYVVSEGDTAFGKSSTVHFSTKNGCFVSAAAPVPAEAASADYSEDTPSSTPDARILEKLEKERRNRKTQISAGVDAITATGNTAATEKLHNNLSCIDRAVQTSHWPAKERGTFAQSQTLEDASGSCSAWEIYDAYVPPGTLAPASIASSIATADHLDGSSAPLSSNDVCSTGLSPSREHTYHNITRVMQRMLYQNQNPDIPADFKVNKPLTPFFTFVGAVDSWQLALLFPPFQHTKSFKLYCIAVLGRSS